MLILFLFVAVLLMVALFWKDYTDAMAEEEKEAVAKDMDEIIDKCKKLKEKDKK